MQPKITIFTQAYNTENYIGKCVDSVLNQTFADFEYIIVDNGSTDKTKEIIAQYAKKDKRIKAVRFEDNRRGFWPDFVKDMAEGEYFSSLDSDDWLDSLFLETLVNMAEKENLDIVICGTCFHNEITNEISHRKSDAEVIIDNSNILLYFRHSYQFFRTVWGKIYKMSVIKNTNYLDFYNIAKTGYGGDTAFCLDALEFTNRIGMSDKVLHHYLVHPKSTSHEYNPKRFCSDTFLFRKAETYLSQFGEISEENYQFIYLVYLDAIFDTIKVIGTANLDMHEKFLEIEKILKEQITQQTFKAIHAHNKVKSFKEIVIKLFVEYGKVNQNNKKMLDLIYSNICLLNSNIGQYVSRQNLLEYINSNFILSAINLNDEQMLKDAISLLNDASLSESIWSAVKGVFQNNILLSWVNNKDFVIKYSQIVIDVYANRLNKAMDKIIESLSMQNEIPFEEELLSMCLNISSAINDSSIFLHAKKLQAQLFIKQKRFNEAEIALKDLLEICPNKNGTLE